MSATRALHGYPEVLLAGIYIVRTKSWRFLTLQARLTGPPYRRAPYRTTLPGNWPVVFPFSHTTVPFTKTSSIPVEIFSGSE